MRRDCRISDEWSFLARNYRKDDLGPPMEEIFLRIDVAKAANTLMDAIPAMLKFWKDAQLVHKKKIEGYEAIAGLRDALVIHCHTLKGRSEREECVNERRS